MTPQKYKINCKNNYEQLYANKLDNLDEMDKFLETYNLPKLNQEELENLNIQIISNEIKSVIKKLPINKCPGLDGFTGKFYETCQEELRALLLKLFHNIQRREGFQTHFIRPALS